MSRDLADEAADPRAAVAHLSPESWQRATRHVIRKALAEFAHERLLDPRPEREAVPEPGSEAGAEVAAEPGPGAGPEAGARPGLEAGPNAGTGAGPALSARADPGAPTAYTVPTDDGSVVYHFTARRLALDHWHIDPASITRRPARGSAAVTTGPPPLVTPGTGSRTDTGTGASPSLPLDALTFFTELRVTLGLDDRVLPLYLEEITATISSLAYKYAKPPLTAAELADGGFQAIESGMTEGHPCFVANSGRLGFGAHDLLRYAPEAGAPVRLMWLAARRELTTFTSGEGMDYFTLLAEELGPRTRIEFEQRLVEQKLDPTEYYLLPVHPWQWEHRLAVTFAGEVALRHLVPLGPGDDEYLPQQSVRTFYNATRPTRPYVKTALSVLNMGFLRGLSAAYMEATPAINDWLAGLIAADPTLTAARFSIIRECAAIGYHHLGYEAATRTGSPYRKMLAALWRESPVGGLEPGRSLATMASLLHVGADGRPFAAELAARSGRTPERWLRGYLDAYLVPVLHSLYAHDLAYMPHGENVILVLGEDGGTVERVVFKDIAEEIVVMDPDRPLPPAVERIRAAVPEDQRSLVVFTDVFDCFLRFMSATLHTAGVLDQDAFWRTVARCVADYQRAHPELAERFARWDLFAERFDLSCLNRLQLRDNQQMVDLADPSAALQLAGTLANPLAAHRDGPAAAASPGGGPGTGAGGAGGE